MRFRLRTHQFSRLLPFQQSRMISEWNFVRFLCVVCLIVAASRHSICDEEIVEGSEEFPAFCWSLSSILIRFRCWNAWRDASGWGKLLRNCLYGEPKWLWPTSGCLVQRCFGVFPPNVEISDEYSPQMECSAIASLTGFFPTSNRQWKRCELQLFCDLAALTFLQQL